MAKQTVQNPKVCKGCNILKPYEAYKRTPRMQAGKQTLRASPFCDDCLNDPNNPEIIKRKKQNLEKNNAFRKTERGKKYRYEYHKKWRTQNADKNREYQKEWAKKYRKANPEKIKKLQNESYQRNKDKVNEKARQWHKKNRAHCREREKQWLKKNPESAAKRRNNVMKKYKNQVANLADRYLKNILRSEGLSTYTINKNPTLIEAKRQELLVKRLIKTKK